MPPSSCEVELLAAAVATVLMIKGSGAWSLDRLLVSSWRKAEPPRLSKPQALRAA